METDQELHLKGKAWLVRWVESRRVQAGSTGQGGCEHGLFSARGRQTCYSPLKEQRVSSSLQSLY